MSIETYSTHKINVNKIKSFEKQKIPFSSDTHKLTCPKCGHSWKYKGNNYRTKCVNCRKKGIITIIKTGLPYKNVGTVGTVKRNSKKSTVPSISDDIMRGNIIDAIDEY